MFRVHLFRMNISYFQLQMFIYIYNERLYLDIVIIIIIFNSERLSEGESGKRGPGCGAEMLIL